MCQNHSCLYLSVTGSNHSWSWCWSTKLDFITCSHLSPVHIITVTESHYNVYHKHVTDNCKWGIKPCFYMHKSCWHNRWNGVLGRGQCFYHTKLWLGLRGEVWLRNEAKFHSIISKDQETICYFFNSLKKQSGVCRVLWMICGQEIIKKISQSRKRK